MIIPIRCFSCGKVIADKYEEYKELRSEGVPIDEVWEKVGIRRFCCKRMISSHVPLVDDLLTFIRLQ